MPIVFSAHAIDRPAERGIDPARVERTVTAPDSTACDPVHPDRTRAFRATPERDGRVLRAAYARSGDDVRIITVLLDRGRRT